MKKQPVITSQLRLNMPKNKEVTDFYYKFLHPAPPESNQGIFKAIKNDVGGWWIYRVHKGNYVFMGSKLIQGSIPVEVQHNKEFIGMDWMNEPEQAIIFLRYK